MLIYHFINIKVPRFVILHVKYTIQITLHVLVSFDEFSKGFNLLRGKLERHTKKKKCTVYVKYIIQNHKERVGGDHNLHFQSISVIKLLEVRDCK